MLGLYTVDPEWRLALGAPVEIEELRGKPDTSVVVGLLPLLRITARLRRLLREERYDVLYAYQGPVAHVISWLATRRLPATTLVWGVQGATSRRRRIRLNRTRLLRKLSAYVSRSVPLLIANSEAGLEARRRSGFKCRRQIVIPQGLDSRVFVRDAPGRERVRAEWGIGDGPLIGLVGRIVATKQPKHFLAAAASVLRSHSDARFVLVGTGPVSYRRELDELSKKLGIAEVVHFAGPRADMSAVYSALDILCSASRSEGRPNAVAEAMACGVPCVVTDVGDSAAIVAGSGCLVVSPGQSEALAAALESMLGRLDEIDPVGLRGLVLERFSVDGFVDATEAALTEARATIV